LKLHHGVRLFALTRGKFKHGGMWLADLGWMAQPDSAAVDGAATG
jgi:hypothetical protein